MMIDTVVLVLRETLEAGMLVSLLIVVATRRDAGIRWLAIALGAGIVMAALYAAALGRISTWFDYTGQEVLDALSQFAVFGCLLLLVVLVRQPSVDGDRWTRSLLILTVMLATMREEVEIIVFYQGFAHDAAAFRVALTSGVIGLAIGISVGVLAYYAVLALKPVVGRGVLQAGIALIGAGMTLQATQSLVQVDLLPATMPLWNTGGIIPEASITGQMLYAVFGYESSPTAPEVIVYGFALAAMLVAIAVAGFRGRRETYS